MNLFHFFSSLRKANIIKRAQNKNSMIETITVGIHNQQQIQLFHSFKVFISQSLSVKGYFYGE